MNINSKNIRFHAFLMFPTPVFFLFAEQDLYQKMWQKKAKKNVEGQTARETEKGKIIFTWRAVSVGRLATVCLMANLKFNPFIKIRVV